MLGVLTVEDLIENAVALAVIDLQHECATEVLLEFFALDLDQNRAVFHLLMVSASLHDF